MSKLTREQWMLSRSLAGAINACNAPFSCGEDEQQEAVSADPNYVKNVGTELAELCSPMALEDTIQVLEAALRISRVQSPTPSVRR